MSSDRSSSTSSRRAFLQRSMLASGGVLAAVPLQALLARGGVRDRESRLADRVGYGPLEPAKDGTTGLPLLLLPKGFEYVTFGWTGDALDDGSRTPASHDGMATFVGANGRVLLVRNHELSFLQTGAISPSHAYDPHASGGTTTLEFDPATRRLTRSWVSLNGTAVNCAGGPTPWGTWLSCEETVAGPETEPSATRDHGYIFEVPLDGRAAPEPLIAMGRFVHEAIAVDPATGIVYETEDRQTSGLYRFLPQRRGHLRAGGSLQMLAVKGSPQLDARTGHRVGRTLPVEWVDIREPNRAHVDVAARDEHGVHRQGFERGGATFSRLEGAWFGNGRVYVVSTAGGDAGRGQVWSLDPARNELQLVFESPSADVLNMPDNVCVSPRGGLALCEDPDSGPVRLHGLSVSGELFPFAQNNVVLAGERNGIAGDFRNRELAGATFSPDGRWLFFNIQTPGITVAVTGPWGTGRL